MWLVLIFNILYVSVFKNIIKKMNGMNVHLGNVSRSVQFPLLLSQKKWAIKKEQGWFFSY